MTDRSAKEYTPEVLAIRCPRCGATPGWACASPKDVTLYVPHLQRKKAAMAQQPRLPLDRRHGGDPSNRREAVGERDFDKRPYSPDEARVAAFLAERGVGGGDDPIGFILVSYALVIEERNAAREELRTGRPVRGPEK